MKIVYLLREYFIPSLPLEVLKYVFNYYYPAPLNTYYYFFIGPIPLLPILIFCTLTELLGGGGGRGVNIFIF